MSKYYVEKYVKVPVLVEVDADDEFVALNNIAHGNWDNYEYTDNAYDCVIDGINGNESIDANYTIIYDKEYKEVRRMTNEVADSYID